MLKCDTLVSEIESEVEEHMWDDLRHEAELKEALKRWEGKEGAFMTRAAVRGYRSGREYKEHFTSFKNTNRSLYFRPEGYSTFFFGGVLPQPFSAL